MKKLTRKLICFICVCTLCITQVIPVMAESSLQNAETMGTSGTVQGAYTENNDTDFYRYTVSPGSSVELNITFTAYNNWNILYLYDVNGNRLDYNYIYTDSSTNQGVEKYTYYLNPGTYYFGSKIYEDGSYKMVYNTKLLNNQDLTEDGMISAAHKIDLNANLTGMLSSVIGDETDIYRIDVENPGVLDINLKSYVSSHMYFRLLDQDGERIDSWTLYEDSATGMAVRKISLPLEKGTYYLEMSSNSRRGGKYTLQQKFTKVSSIEKEPNDSMEQAQSLSLGKTASGIIGYSETADFYKFKVSAKKNVTFTLNSKLGYVQLYIYNADGEEVKYKSAYSNSNTGRSSIKEIYNLPAGSYYLQIRSENYAGTYTLNAAATKKPVKPVVTLKRDNRNYYNLTVRHKKVAGAAGYQVYLATNSKFKKAAKYTYTNAPTTYSVTKKRTWYVKVRAYKLNSDGQYIYGNFSKVKKIKM